LCVDIVRELFYTGRIFSGEEVVHLGLVTRGCDSLLDDALNLARANF
jgi:enoyl-CoA hydratase/carnithine racemase